MAVDCNIVEKALKKVKLKAWGFENDNVIDKGIAISYLEYLACEGVSLKSCHDLGGNCDDGDTFKNVSCNMNVRSISYSTTNIPNNINFYLGVTDIFNAVGPLTYLWSYDTAVFEIIGNVTDSVVGFKFKTGYNPTLTVTWITVTITDANGCTDSKTCKYINGVMQCAINFVSCFPVNDLEITSLYTACKRPTDLVVENYTGDFTLFDYEFDFEFE